MKVLPKYEVTWVFLGFFLVSHMTHFRCFSAFIDISYSTARVHSKFNKLDYKPVSRGLLVLHNRKASENQASSTIINLGKFCMSCDNHFCRHTYMYMYIIYLEYFLGRRQLLTLIIDHFKLSSRQHL